MIGWHRYRMITSLQRWDCVGRLEKVDKTIVLLLRVTTDQAFAAEFDLNKGTPVEVFAIAGDDLVLPALIRKVKAMASGNAVELACLLRE